MQRLKYMHKPLHSPNISLNSMRQPDTIKNEGIHVRHAANSMHLS